MGEVIETIFRQPVIPSVKVAQECSEIEEWVPLFEPFIAWCLNTGRLAYAEKAIELQTALNAESAFLWDSACAPKVDLSIYFTGKPEV